MSQSLAERLRAMTPDEARRSRTDLRNRNVASREKYISQRPTRPSTTRGPLSLLYERFGRPFPVDQLCVGIGNTFIQEVEYSDGSCKVFVDGKESPILYMDVLRAILGKTGAK